MQHSTDETNGNMTTRIENGVTYHQTLNGENRLVSVTASGQTTTMTYDGDGQRVKKVDAGGTTYSVGGYYEVKGSTVTQYDYLGGQRVAVRAGGMLYYLHGDHLGSTSLTTSISQTVLAEQHYYPYGEVRWSSGALPTDYRFTGQREESGIKLYDYRARYYSPYLNRWIQPDPIIPDLTDPQNLNRYAYVLGNPVKFRDPSGHCIPGYNCPGDRPSRPRIVPRSGWGAREPGVYDSLVDRLIRGCGGCKEGFYDPVNNTSGYASYSQLEPGVSLREKLHTAVIHHEGNNQTYDVQRVQNKHMFDNGWTDIGYHYVVGPDGAIYEGRDVGVRGSHVEGKNTGRIGILLLGDFQPGPSVTIGSWTVYADKDDLGPTKAQVQSTMNLLTWLDYEYGIDDVVGHRNLNPTECPGNYCMPYITKFNDAVQEW